MLEFVLNNWYLFLALGVVVALLLAGPLMRFIRGIQELGPNQAVLLVNRENGVLVDVREPNEFREGHIPRALNIPLSQFKGRVGELEKYKDRPVVLCCRSGNRSLKAAVLLKRQGFAKVYSLAGGLLAWQRENLPVDK